MYKKRAGTSGISGQLYETKLISLLQFRLLKNENVEQFHLASNMDEVGAFDDICLRIKMTDNNTPVLIFAQIKHKENDDKFLTLENKNDLVKWADSIMKIKQKFCSNKSKDKIFNGKFDDAECLFVLYTNAKYDCVSNNEAVDGFVPILNSLIATSDEIGVRPRYTDSEIEDFGLKILNEEITMLAECLVKYLNNKSSQTLNILNDEYILRYHVILAQKVVNLSDMESDKDNPQSKWRTLTFRADFFNTRDKYLVVLRKCIYEQVYKSLAKPKRTNSEEEERNTLDASGLSIEDLISSFLEAPTATTLSPLIGTNITYRSGRLMFNIERPESDVQKLEQIQFSPFTVDEAKAMAAKNILLSLQLKVPITFGNMDLAVRSKRQALLTDLIVDLCKEPQLSGAYKIVTIDENVDSRLLKANGGLGSGVGNILVYDEDTKLLKFSDDNSSLQENAKSLLLKLRNNIKDLGNYRIDVKTVRFPKLSMDCSDMAKDFLSKLVIYAKQCNHQEVENILKKEIKLHHKADPQVFSETIDSIFLYYHNEIQKWWMSPKSGLYLTKTSDMYQQALNNVVRESQMSALQSNFYMINLKYFGYHFSEDAIQLCQPINTFSKNIIVSDISTLTYIKVIQCLRNNSDSKYAVLDFQCVLNLPKEQFDALIKELENTEKTVIVMCENLKQNRAVYKRMDEFASAIEEKKIIAITNNSCLEMIQDFLPQSNVLDDGKQGLGDLRPESRRDVIVVSLSNESCDEVYLTFI